MSDQAVNESDEKSNPVAGVAFPPSHATALLKQKAQFADKRRHKQPRSCQKAVNLFFLSSALAARHAQDRNVSCTNVTHRKSAMIIHYAGCLVNGKIERTRTPAGNLHFPLEPQGIM
jgi:hypothetical protein